MGIIICIQRVLPRKSNWFDSNMFHLRETNHISQGSRQTEAIGCVCVCVERETGELGSSSPKAVCRQNSFLLGKVGLGSSQAFD